MKKTLMLLVSASLATSASAAITFVNADGSNTSATGGSPDPFFTTKNNSSVDNALWDQRAFGTGGQAYQANINSATNTIPELTTQITGLADGTYDIYVFFYANNEPWNVEAGLTSGALTNYEANAGDASVVDATTLSFTTDPTFNTATTINLFAANVGQATVTGGSAVDVFINHNDNELFSNNRTWYDGVGFELVPEPSSSLLLGLGALALLRRRRV